MKKSDDEILSDRIIKINTKKYCKNKMWLKLLSDIGEAFDLYRERYYILKALLNDNNKTKKYTKKDIQKIDKQIEKIDNIRGLQYLFCKYSMKEMPLWCDWYKKYL